MFNPIKDKSYSHSIHKWTLFKSQFERSFELFKRRKACLQIISSIYLSSPKNGKIIPVNFEIFLNSKGSSVKDYGHWSFDLSGESADFSDANCNWDFNDFFERKNENKKNILFFKKIIEFCELRNQPIKNIRKINVGDNSLPWCRIHNAIYVYRDTVELFQEDLFKDFELIREELNNTSILIEEEKRDDLQKIWSNGFLTKIKQKPLLEAVNTLNKTYHFMTQFFKSESKAQISSFKTYHQNGYQPLYDVIEKFYLHLNETMNEVTDWEKIWKNFINKWRDKYQ